MSTLKDDLETVLGLAVYGDAEQGCGIEEPAIARVRGIASGAALDVLTERQRQFESEGWTPEHDDQHRQGEMASAAASYAVAAIAPDEFLDCHPSLWPWDFIWWKPADRRRMLVKAGALILAEIERLDRQA